MCNGLQGVCVTGSSETSISCVLCCSACSLCMLSSALMHFCYTCPHDVAADAAGRDMSPPEFEKLGGKASAKKWKASVRYVAPDGSTRQTIGDWLQVGSILQTTSMQSPHGHSRGTKCSCTASSMWRRCGWHACRMVLCQMRKHCKQLHHAPKPWLCRLCMHELIVKAPQQSLYSRCSKFACVWQMPVQAFQMKAAGSPTCQVAQALLSCH